MALGNLVWTFIVYAVTAAIVFICFQLVAGEKIATEREATQRLFRARQADRGELGAVEKPKLPPIPVRTLGGARTLGKFPFRLLR